MARTRANANGRRLATPRSVDAAIKMRGDTERSWMVERKEIEARGYDLKAVNPNAKREEDLRNLRSMLQ